MARSITLVSSSNVADEALVVRSQQGDSEALEVLLRRYRSFARSKAHSYFLVGADADDVEQEGLIGLCKAVDSFRPERHVSFRAFAEVCVTRQVISAVKAATRYKHGPLNRYVPLSGLPGSGDPSGRTFEEILDDRRILDPADAVISSERLRAIHRSIAENLSGLEVDVFRLYVEGKSYEEIGVRLGRRTKSIDNALQRIKRKLDQHLNDDDVELVA